MVSGEGFPFPMLGRALRERHASGRTPDEDFRHSLRLMLTGLRVLGEGVRLAWEPAAGG